MYACAFPWASRAKAQLDLPNHQASYELLGPGLLIGASPSFAGCRRQAAGSADRQGCYTHRESPHGARSLSLGKGTKSATRHSCTASIQAGPCPVCSAALGHSGDTTARRRAQNVSKPQFPVSTNDRRRMNVLTIHAGASPARLAGDSWRLLPCCTSVARCQSRPFFTLFHLERFTEIIRQIEPQLKL
jgi:hypothetical protein